MTQATQSSVGRFTLLEQVGSTGLASVYRAQDPSDGADVALKLLRNYISHDQEFIRSFFRQIERVQTLQHPHILVPLEVGRDEQNGWLVLPWIEGQTLEQMLRKAPLHPAQSLAILRQVADALDYASAQGVLHRDLKPGNIFLNSAGEALVSDFGLTMLAEGAHALIRATLNTPHPNYTAPEQAQGEEPQSASDVYSLGAIAYELLTGEVLFSVLGTPTVLAKQLTSTPSPPTSHNPSLPLGCDTILLKALSRHPLERYATAGEFINALEEILRPAAAQSVSAPASLSPTVGAPSQEGQGREPAQVTVRSTETLSEEEFLCPSCGHDNPPGRIFCEACWIRLTNRRLATREQVTVMRRLVARKLRVRRSVSLSAVAVVLGLIGYYAFTTFYTPSVPSPTTQVSSISAQGETAMLGLNPARTAATSRGPQLKGVLAWRFETSGGLLASPAIVGGVVYQPTGDRRVIALDAENSRLLWEHPTTGPIDSSPAVADGLLYYGQRDGNLVALDTKTGQLAWQYLTDGPIFASPVVHRGVVYIGTAGGSLMALDAKDGEMLWTFEVPRWILSPIALNEEVLVASSSSGEAYILDLKTGKVRFVFDAERLLQSSPVFAGDRLFLTTSLGTMMAVDWRQREYPLERTARYWRYQFWIWGLQELPPIPKGLLWTRAFGRRYFVSSPAVLEDAVYVSVSKGNLVAMDTDTGKTLWEYDVGAPTRSDPEVAGAAVYIGDRDGIIHAVNRRTGEGLWTLETQGPITTKPVVAGDTLYIASRDGSLYAIR